MEFKRFARLLWTGIALGFWRHSRQTSLEWFKLRATLGYVKSVQAARKLFLIAIAAILGAGLLVAGFVLAHVGLGLLLRACFPGGRVTAWTFLILGIFYALGPLIALWRLTSEKQWMQASRADKLVRYATKPHQSERP